MSRFTIAGDLLARPDGGWPRFVLCTFAACLLCVVTVLLSI